MGDPLEDLLRRSPLTKQQRHDLWDTYEGSQDADVLASKIKDMSIPKQVKRSLWDLKEASAKPAGVPKDPTVEAFPTPGETALTFAGGAVRAIPGMLKGAVSGAMEGAALASGLGPTDAAQEDMNRHIQAAMAPGASVGTRVSEGVQALPMVGPMAAEIARGAKTILTPAAKTAAGIIIPNQDVNVGTITPEEMNAAADTGGAAVANLAAPKVVSKVTPATVGKVLKFTAKNAALEAVAPGGTVAGKIISHFVTSRLMKMAGTYAQDVLIGAIENGNVGKAAETLSKVLEKNPDLAAAHAQEVAKVMNPEAAPAKTYSPVDSSPAAVEARNAAKRARRGTLAKSQERAGAAGTVVATPVVEEALTTLEKRAPMPEKGNVKPATVYTKPTTKPIEGRPLTPKQREMRLKQLEAAQAAGLDIWEAFGVAKDN
jgi:hypothetical protein